MTAMNVVITGAAGRIGRYVLREFAAAGHAGLGVDVAPAHGPCLRVDLTDAGQVYGALAGADAVVHMGAWANAGLVPDTRTYADNVTGTYNVFQACADLGIRRVVSASSAQVYGFFAHDPLQLPVDEGHPLRPLNSYAASKIAGEQAAAYFSERHGLEILSLRIMGARMPAELPAEIAAMQADPASGKGLLWTRVDARDVALACRQAVEAKALESGPCNLTGAQVVVDADTAALLEAHVAHPPRWRGERSARDSPMSCARARRLFGYRPRYVWSVHDQHPEP